MVDLNKIDAFFDGIYASDTSKHKRVAKNSSTLLLAKLLMPSIASVLIALILVLPNIKKNNIISEYDMMLLKKSELKKLHAEEATFSITEKNGKISVLTADSMNEVEGDSKTIKIINPKGKIPVNKEGVFIDISSNIGFFDQPQNMVTLEKNIKAVYDGKTIIETEEGTYDFQKSYGYGNKKVYAYGSWGKLWSDGFAYDKEKEILYLKRNIKVLYEENILTAQTLVKYEKLLNRIEAKGNVKLQRPDSILSANRVILYLQNEKNMQIKEIEAFDNVRIETRDGVASGDYGLYLPQLNEVELEGNVSIEKDGNMVYGDKAVSNLETTISKMFSNKKRVSGVIRGTSIKRKK